MKIRTANPNDLDDLYEFYAEVIDQQPFDEYGAGWTKDVYPSMEDLKRHIEEDIFYLGLIDEKIVCAIAVCLKEDEAYKAGDWKLKLADDQIAVLHLFGVAPEYRGRGLSLKMLNFIKEDLRSKVKAIHLDVVKGNKRAFKMYEKAGFEHIGEISVYYEDTGDIIVDLFEYDYKK